MTITMIRPTSDTAAQQIFYKIDDITYEVRFIESSERAAELVEEGWQALPDGKPFDLFIGEQPR